MKKLMNWSGMKILVLAFILTASLPVLAQPDGPPPKLTDEQKEKVENLKISYFTTQIGLTTEEAQLFWPLHNQQREEMDALHQQYLGGMKSPDMNIDNMNDAEVLELMENRMAFEEAKLAVHQKYHQQYLDILPVKKVAKFYKAEMDFKKKLLEVLGKGNAFGGGNGGPPPGMKN